MDQREFEHRFRTAWHSLCLSVAAQDHASSEDERLADAFRQETEEMRREEEDPRHGGARE